MLARLTDPQLWLVVLVISAVGVLTKLAYYSVGRKGKDTVIEHVPKLTPERFEDLNARYERTGPRILLFASVPGVGSALTAIAGVIGIRIATFIFWVAISTLIRNWFLLIVFGQAISVLSLNGS